MKRTTNNSIDKMISEALSESDRAEFEALGEPSIFEQIAETFCGKTRWINCILIMHTVIFTTLCGMSIYKFFNAAEVREQILWAATCVLSIVIIAMLKIWYWMEMNRVTLMREIKRLELQVVRLATK